MANHSVTGRMAEHLVCAELGRRNLIASTFTHNIPRFDLVVADQLGNTLPIQVKGSNSDSWSFDGTKLMEIHFDAVAEIQTIVSETPCPTPDLIWVCVAIVSEEQQKDGQRDRFFILTECEIHRICIQNYCTMLEVYRGHRPKNWRSETFYWNTDDLAKYENKWELIRERLDASA